MFAEMTPPLILYLVHSTLGLKKGMPIHLHFLQICFMLKNPQTDLKIVQFLICEKYFILL